MIEDKRDPGSEALQTARQESEKWNWKFENVVKHPTAPLPFYVIDLAKYKDADKVLWMRQEIGADRTLGEFVDKFVELFRGLEKLRFTCLKVYALYSGRAISKEADLPPCELEVFKRAFDPEQPSLCQECGKPVDSLRSQYCSNACKQAGKTFHCRKCPRPMIMKMSFRIARAASGAGVTGSHRTGIRILKGT